MGEKMDYHYDDDGQSKTGHPVVVAVPGCLFNGVQVCLSIKGKADLNKLKVMAARFQKWYFEQEKKGIIVPSSIGAPIRLN